MTRASRRRPARLQFRRRHPQAQSRRRARRESRLSSITAAARATRQLADRVERFGHVLRALDVRREERVLMCLLDTIDWPTAFLGAIKAGVVAVPVNTLMTEDDYRFMLDDSRARLLVVSEELLPKFAKAIETSKHLDHVIVSGDKAHGHQRFDELLEAAKTDAVTAPTTRDDMCFLALHVGLDRQAERRRAHPRRSQAHRRSLCRAHPRHHRKGRLLLGGKTVLRLRPRQCADVPDVGRRHHGAVAGSADAGSGRRASEEARGHGVLRGADVLCRLPRQPGGAGSATSSKSAAASPPAKRCRRTSAGAGANATASTSSTASARPRCCTSS